MQKIYGSILMLAFSFESFAQSSCMDEIRKKCPKTGSLVDQRICVEGLYKETPQPLANCKKDLESLLDFDGELGGIDVRFKGRRPADSKAPDYSKYPGAKTKDSTTSEISSDVSLENDAALLAEVDDDDDDNEARGIRWYLKYAILVGLIGCAIMFFLKKRRI